MDANNDGNNTLTTGRDSKRSKSLNQEIVSGDLVDNAKVRRRTSSESDDPIFLKNGIVARNKRLGKWKDTGPDTCIGSLDKENMLVELDKLSNLGNCGGDTNVGCQTDENTVDTTTRSDLQNGRNLVSWKSLSPKQSFKSCVSSPESSESDTVIENKPGTVNLDGTKMSCDSPVTCSSASSSPLHRSRNRSVKNSVISSDETFNNSYFYDEDFQVQFDTNIRNRPADAQDSMLDFSDAFSDDLPTGSYNHNDNLNHKHGETSSAEASVVSSTAMTCSSDVMQLSNGPLFATNPYYEGPLHNFSTDSLDHDRYLMTASNAEEEMNQVCKPKKENYMLSFSGYSDKRGSSDASISSDESCSSIPSHIDHHDVNDPISLDSPPSHCSSNDNSDKDSDASHPSAINKWATCRNLVSPSASHSYKNTDKSSSANSLTCWNNIKTKGSSPENSVPKSTSLEEVRKMSQSPYLRNVISYGDVDGRTNVVSSPVPSSLLDIYRHSRAESSYEDGLDEVETSDYIELGQYHRNIMVPLTNSDDSFTGTKHLSRCQSVENDYSKIPKSDHRRSLSSPMGNWRECRNFGYKNEVLTQFPSVTSDKFTPWSGTRNFGAQFPPNTKECGMQTSGHLDTSTESEVKTKPPPRSRSCPQNMSAEFDDFLTGQLMHRSRSLTKWMPSNAESVYRDVFEAETPSLGVRKQRGYSSSPMRPVKSVFYSHNCHKSLPDLTFLDDPLNPEHLNKTESRARTQTHLKTPKTSFAHIKNNCTTQPTNFSIPRVLQTRSKSTGSLPDKMNIRGPIPPKSFQTTRNHGKVRPQELASSSGASSSSSGIDPGYYEYVPFGVHSYGKNCRSMNSFNSGYMHYDVPPIHVMCCCGYDCNTQFTNHKPDLKPDSTNTGVTKQKPPELGSLGDLYAVNEETTPTISTPDSATKDIGLHTDLTKEQTTNTSNTDTNDNITNDTDLLTEKPPLKSCLRNRNRQDNIHTGRRCQSVCGQLQREKFSRTIPTKNHRNSYDFDSGSTDDFAWMLDHALEIPGDLRCATDSHDLILASAQTYVDGCPDDLCGSKFTMSSSGGNTSDDIDKKEKRKSVSFASEISIYKTGDTTTYTTQPQTQDDKSGAVAATSPQGQSTEEPPDYFRATSPLTNIVLSAAEEQQRKIGYLTELCSAVKSLVAHFAKGRQPHHKVRTLTELCSAVKYLFTNFAKACQPHHNKLKLGNIVETPSLGHIVLSHLCPALARIISDGLRPHLSGLHSFGKISLTVWRVAEVSVELGGSSGALSDLVKELRNRADLVSTRQRFEAFVFGLLNLRMLDGWLCQVREKEAIMMRFYEPSALLCESHDLLRAEYEDTIMSLQLLTVLPFQMDYSHVVSYHTSQLSRDVDDICLENKYSQNSSVKSDKKNVNEQINGRKNNTVEPESNVTKFDVASYMSKFTKDWFKNTDSAPVKDTSVPTVDVVQTKRSWSFTGALFGMATSMPENVLQQAIGEGGVEFKTGKTGRNYKLDGQDNKKVTPKTRHEKLLELMMPGDRSREMFTRRHSDNSDTDKKTPPPKPKRLSKSERELLQSLEEFKLERDIVGMPMVDGDLIDLSDEAVFGDKGSEGDYVNVPSPVKMVGTIIGQKLGQETSRNEKNGVEKVGQYSKKIGSVSKSGQSGQESGKVGHDSKRVSQSGHELGQTSSKVGQNSTRGGTHKMVADKKDGLIDIGKRSEVAAGKSGSEKKVCRVFADKLSHYESSGVKKAGIPENTTTTNKNLVTNIGKINTTPAKDLKNAKPSKLPVFSPSKRSTNGKLTNSPLKNSPVKQNNAAKPPIAFTKPKITPRKTGATKTHDTTEKNPSKFVKLFDKILLPRSKVQETKINNRWSWSGANTPAATGSKIPSLKTKTVDKSDVKMSPRNRFGFVTKAPTTMVSPPKPATHPATDDLDVSLCDLADIQPISTHYDEIDDAYDVPRHVIDGNANFLDAVMEVDDYSPDNCGSIERETLDGKSNWDSFKKPDYKYVKTRADSPTLENPDNSELAYERGQKLHVLAKLNDDWLYCGDAHHEGLVRMNSVDPVE